MVERLAEELQIHRDLLTTQRDDRAREIDELRRDVQRQGRRLIDYEQTVAELRATINDLLRRQSSLNNSALHQRTTAEPVYPTGAPYLSTIFAS